ncbi:hypothetical protein QC761_0069160 [Podospora bellae-mahoneyi]|uniref:Uncharacterized protein n=1 Tax=Podospora bellae-mahoneyi TaxID=2093777 RepID=A0ABR0FIP4_9PEZI|nr:hypothetical protein QC761_0069160 [Podospora bellae-mahoneyi]
MFVGFLLVPEALENALNELALSCLAGEIRFFVPISLPDKNPRSAFVSLDLVLKNSRSCRPTQRAAILRVPESAYPASPSTKSAAARSHLAHLRHSIPVQASRVGWEFGIESGGVRQRKCHTPILISGPVRRHGATPPTTLFAHGPNPGPRDASSCSHSLLAFHPEKVIYPTTNQICRTAARAARHP